MTDKQDVKEEIGAEQSCCDPSATVAEEITDDQVRKNVQKSYAKLATGKRSGCGPSLPDLGYSDSELGELPDDVTNVAAGCGNPTALTSISPGETILDLGSGGGIDVFLAAKQTGPSGKAIGVDMTPEMIEKATENAEKMGLENIEFRQGIMEELPVENESVDLIISNCVINLSPDKDQVFREAYRVLRPGGRIAVSDIVVSNDLPEEIRKNTGSWAACVGGALRRDDYLSKIKKAGFTDVESKGDPSGRIKVQNAPDIQVISLKVTANKPN